MSVVRQPAERAQHPRGTDNGGSDLQAPPLHGLPQEVHLDPDGAGDGDADGGGNGAGDPAFDFFRQDAERHGYAGPARFAEYLKAHGILSESKQRRIAAKEVTGLDLELL